MRKSILSVLLCIVMVLSLMPTAVFAAEGDSGVKLYVRNPKSAQNEHEVVAGKTFTVQAVATGLGSGVYLNDSNIEWTLSEHHDGTTLSLNDPAQVTRDLHVDENETAEIITITATLKSDPTVFGTYYVNVRPQPKYVSEINLTYNTSLINTGSTYAEAAQAVADNYAVSGDGAIKGYYSSSNCSMYQLNDSSKWPITSDAALSANCTDVRESIDTISTDKDLIFVFQIQAAPDTQNVRPLAPEYDFDEDNLSGITVKINGVEQSVVVRRYNDAWRSVKLYVLIPKDEIADTFKSVAVTGVSLNKSSTSITFGKNERLTATVLPEIATNKSVTWTSDNTSVATVDASGYVTAVAAGTATITVTTADGSKTATCEVTVTPVAVTGVTLNETSASIVVGATEQLTATVAPENAPNKNVTWTSSNTSVATVDADGVVTAVAAGTATITATTVEGGFSATCTVTVTPVAVTGVTLNKTRASIVAGTTETLTATVAPDNATNKNVTWTSSNTSVATVDADGVVTAVAAGTAIITVTTEDGGFTASCEVTVTPVAVTGVTLNETSASIVVGATEQLTATVAPENAPNKNVTWTSSNTSVATVDADGVVTAVAAGTATITVTTEDGGKTAACEVTVTPTTYSIISGANGEWTKDSSDGLAFTSDADFAKFVCVMVDDAEIAATNYTAVSGSTKVTLNAAYLETLSVGSHSIDVVSNNGTASTSFTVKAATPTDPTDPIDPIETTVDLRIGDKEFIGVKGGATLEVTSLDDLQDITVLVQNGVDIEGMSEDWSMSTKFLDSEGRGVLEVQVFEEGDDYVTFNLQSHYADCPGAAVDDFQIMLITLKLPTGEKMLGDANADGAVNMKDVLALRKFLAGMNVSVDMANSDVNEDTFVNMKDVLMMRKFLANVIDKLGA